MLCCCRLALVNGVSATIGTGDIGGWRFVPRPRKLRDFVTGVEQLAFAIVSSLAAVLFSLLASRSTSEQIIESLAIRLIFDGRRLWSVSGFSSDWVLWSLGIPDGSTKLLASNVLSDTVLGSTSIASVLSGDTTVIVGCTTLPLTSISCTSAELSSSLVRPPPRDSRPGWLRRPTATTLFVSTVSNDSSMLRLRDLRGWDNRFSCGLMDSFKVTRGSKDSSASSSSSSPSKPTAVR
uniref:(northern house mosquito) hypothetical protein n=1 Tax=Culex pipiens TaxID=7175 RepID=A0A8D8CIY8_CULPI